MEMNDGAANEQWSGLVVGLVGHCGPDSFGLMRFVKRTLPGAVVKQADDGAAVEALRGRPAVLLVNRVLDGRFHTDSGLELIEQLRTSGESSVTVLISNYDDAQQAAVTAGAQPGFGKKQLKSDVAAQRLRAAAQMALAGSGR